MHIIFVPGADLALKNGRVVIGPQTKAICDAAAKLYHKLESAVIVVTAGYSKEWKVQMAAEIMLPYLENKVGRRDHIIAGTAKSWNTLGEAIEAAQIIGSFSSREDTAVVIGRWWHVPRAIMLLAICLRRAGASIESVQGVYLPSVSFREILREPIAILINIWRIVSKNRS